MELSSNLIHIAQDMVLEPGWTGAVAIFWFSLFNELSGVIPYVVIIYGQLFFIDAGSFSTLVSKLFWYTAIPSAVGGTIGSFFIYILAYFGGRSAIDRFGKHLWFSWNNVEKVNRHFKGSWYDELIFLALRCIPVLPSLPITLAAGIIQMSPLTYFVCTLVGFVVRMTIMFLFIGYSLETLAQ